MRKRVLFAGIPALTLVFGMALIGCNSESTDGDVRPGAVRAGTIIIIGINPQYNGRYAMFQSSRPAEPEKDGYLLTPLISNDTPFGGALIADGSVSLPVNLIPYDSNQLDSYDENDSGLKIYVTVNPNLP